MVRERVCAHDRWLHARREGDDQAQPGRAAVVRRHDCDLRAAVQDDTELVPAAGGPGLPARRRHHAGRGQSRSHCRRKPPCDGLLHEEPGIEGGCRYRRFQPARRAGEKQRSGILRRAQGLQRAVLVRQHSDAECAGCPHRRVQDVLDGARRHHRADQSSFDPRPGHDRRARALHPGEGRRRHRPNRGRHRRVRREGTAASGACECHVDVQRNVAATAGERGSREGGNPRRACRSSTDRVACGR